MGGRRGRRARSSPGGVGKGPLPAQLRAAPSLHPPLEDDSAKRPSRGEARRRTQSADDTAPQRRQALTGLPSLRLRRDGLSPLTAAPFPPPRLPRHAPPLTPPPPECTPPAPFAASPSSSSSSPTASPQALSCRPPKPSLPGPLACRFAPSPCAALSLPRSRGHWSGPLACHRPRLPRRTRRSVTPTQAPRVEVEDGHHPTRPTINRRPLCHPRRRRTQRRHPWQSHQAPRHPRL